MNAPCRTLSLLIITAALGPAACDMDGLSAADGDPAVATMALAGADEPAEPATALIRYWDGPTMRGSGTLVAPNVILSNAHATFGGAAGMYVQLGTYTTPFEVPIPVLEKRHHPDWAVAGGHDATHDLGLLRLACNVTDVTPAHLNRAALETSMQHGDTIKAVGYGPTAAMDGPDWGTKRFMSGTFSSAGSFVSVSGVSAYSGDSGGSLYGWPRTDDVPSDDETGQARMVSSAKKLIGVITFSGGTSVRVDRHASWIQSWIDDWADPTLPDLPRVRTLLEEQATSLCRRAATVGTYAVDAPEAGVTYTWSATGATIVGDDEGPSVQVVADSNAPFTLEVMALRDDAGCGRRFAERFTPAACLKPKGLRGW